MSGEIRVLPYLYEYVKVNKNTLFLLAFYLAVFAANLAFSVLSDRWRKALKKAVNYKTVLAAAVFLTIALHSLWIYTSPYQTKADWGSSPTDFDLINIHAVDITRGVWFQNADGSPSGRRPIGYPMFLGLWYRLFGAHLAAAWALQVLLAVAMTILIYLIGKYTFSERVGSMAAFLFSCYPVSVYSSKLTTDEHLFLPLLYLGLFLLIRDIAASSYRLRNWVVYGAIFGYAAMTRTHAIVAPLVIASAYLAVKLNKKKILLAVVVVFAVMQLLNLPWVIRNYRAWKVPVLYTATGQFVYGQLNSSARGNGGGHIPLRGEEGFSEELDRALASGNEGMVHKTASGLMIKWCLRHPVQFTMLGMEKTLEFMGVNRRGVWPLWFEYADGSFDRKKALSPKARKILEHAAYAHYYILFFTFIFSLFYIKKKYRVLPFYSRAAVTALSATFLLFLAEQFFIYADRKYRFPLEPIMLIFACACIDYLIFEFKFKLKLNPKKEV